MGCPVSVSLSANTSNNISPDFVRPTLALNLSLLSKLYPSSRKLGQMEETYLKYIGETSDQT